MSRLIVVSNRVSMPSPDGSQGGLAVALQAALRQSGGLWFGWSGHEVEEFTGSVNFEEVDGVRSAVVDLEPQDVEEAAGFFPRLSIHLHQRGSLH